MLSNTQIEAAKIIIEVLKKEQEKYDKKAEKEKAKVKNPYVTYQGEKYYTENDLMEAYACDIMSSTMYDKLLLKLSNKIDENRGYTHNEMISIEIQSYIYNIQRDLKSDEMQKEHQNHIDNRVKELCDSGYSIKEAESIVGNEELMRYE